MKEDSEIKIEELTREQQEQAKACKTKEEITAFIRENNIELSAEQMQQITGGVDKCPGDRRGKEKPAVNAAYPRAETMTGYSPARPAPERFSETYGMINCTSAPAAARKNGAGSIWIEIADCRARLQCGCGTG